MLYILIRNVELLLWNHLKRKIHWTEMLSFCIFKPEMLSLHVLGLALCLLLDLELCAPACVLLCYTGLNTGCWLLWVVTCAASLVHQTYKVHYYFLKICHSTSLDSACSEIDRSLGGFVNLLFTSGNLCFQQLVGILTCMSAGASHCDVHIGCSALGSPAFTHGIPQFPLAATCSCQTHGSQVAEPGWDCTVSV